MSYQIGIDRLHLRSTPRIGRLEYFSNLEYLARLFMETYGRRPLANEFGKAGQMLQERYPMDLNWGTWDGPPNWHTSGRTTDMGKAIYAGMGEMHDAAPSPFKTVEEVYAFDAVSEYPMPEFDELVCAYEANYQARKAANSEQVNPGGYYNTMVSGAIAAFGWDMLLQAAADQDRFEKVLDTFFQRTLFYNKAWAQTSIEAFIQHDDMVWTAGPFLHPDFYRRVIFPRYSELWKPLRAAGKKVLFCSDGNFTQFIGDIAEAGADGFLFEPITSLEEVIRQFGNTHVIVSSKVDCRTLTLGTIDDVRAEVDNTLALAKKCPGFFFAVGNHIAPNTKLENVAFYLDYVRQNSNTDH